MPIEVTVIQAKVYLLRYIGRVRLAELEATYRELVAIEDMVYLLADGTEMMYEPTVLRSDTLTETILTGLKRDTFKCLFLVAHEDHPLRTLTAKFYESIGYAHKIRFVTSRDEGLKIINQLLTKKS